MAKFLYNSSASNSLFNGRLEYVGDGTEAEGTPWLPFDQAEIETRYIRNSTISLIDLDGKGSLRNNSQWTPPIDVEWTITGVYDVVIGSSYKIYSIHYKGNDLMDIYHGDQNIPLAITHENIGFTPPQTAWLFKEGYPDVLTIDGIIYNMDSFHTQ